MNAQQDISWLVNNYHKTDNSHVELLDNLVDEYPYCSAFHVWRVDLAHRLNDPELENKLQRASLVVQDRTVLFNIINNDGLPDVTIIPDNSVNEAEETPLQIEEEPLPETVIQEIEAFPEPVEAPIEPAAESAIPASLEPEAYPTPEAQPEPILEAVEIQEEVQPEPISEESEPVETSLQDQGGTHDFLYWLKQSKGESAEPETVEAPKPIEEETASESLPSSSIWDDLAGKSSSSEIYEEQVSEETPTQSKEIAPPIFRPFTPEIPTEKEEEEDPLEKLYKEEAYRWNQEELSAKPQIERKPRSIALIDKFIESNPSIHNARKDDTKKIENKARKSGDLTPVLATETLADIMVKQGHYEKAINILKDLIIKMPHKKHNFASRIEQIREDYLKK